MRKKLVLFGAIAGVFLLASCTGNKKSTEPAYNAEEVENANNVIKYYDTSLSLLKNVVKEKNVNAVLGYMEQPGNVPAVPAVTPPALSGQDSTALMNPDLYFTIETAQNLKQNFSGLFQTRALFYANFDKYLALMKAKKMQKAKDLLNMAYQLSIQMSEYKQNIFDILSPFVNKAQEVVLADNPMKEQILAMKKMSSTMLSIVNLYGHKHLFDSERIDLKVIELNHELDAAKKLPAVKGHEGEIKDFENYLSKVETFIKQVQQASQKGEYSDADYEMVTSAYETSVI